MATAIHKSDFYASKIWLQYIFNIGCWIHTTLKPVDASSHGVGKTAWWSSMVCSPEWVVVSFQWTEYEVEFILLLSFFIEFINYLLQHGHINIRKVECNKLSGRRSSECPLDQNCWRSEYFFEKGNDTMLGQSDAGQNVLRLSLTENCSSYTNSAYICNMSSKNDD
jgi:hypothetical protein